MKRVAILFLVAVIIPSLALAWLAVRSLRDQEYLLQRQQSLLYQGVADAVANEVQAVLAEKQRVFGEKVSAMLQNKTPMQAALTCDSQLRQDWPLTKVGFAVTLSGVMLCPSPDQRPDAKIFCDNNGRFLGNRESAEVYQNNKMALNSPGIGNSVQMPSESPGDNEKRPLVSKGQNIRNVFPQQAANPSQQKQALVEDQQYSKVTPAEAEFRQLIGDDKEGTMARFVDNKLNLFFWRREAAASNLVFGAEIALPELVAELKPHLEATQPGLREDICVALLDDTAKPVARTREDFTTSWKRPFVATEIGEALPHWEAAVYLLRPEKIGRAAQTLRLTLALVIAVLVLAIGVGSWLIVSDLNRQLALARQKTDFVSNVSHELKTPLTSIRMFSELLAEGRVDSSQKQRAYLRIITSEAARLTRLINNVLDFAGLDRGEKRYELKECDLASVVTETAESYRPHLETTGFTFETRLPGQPVWIRGDRDALAQVIVNLISNAEKYSQNQKEIVLQLEKKEGASCAVVSVMDRGLGVPAGCEERIFEEFYRAHDSLSSGIQGSGLGLALARRIARYHGGEIRCQKREGGGTCFTFTVPLARPPVA